MVIKIIFPIKFTKMGDCLKGEEAKKDQKINNEQKKKKINESKEIRLLLLGTGESGKSTLFKYYLIQLII
jgi:polynucleotide 5'-kinase involved in rRNA processing